MSHCSIVLSSQALFYCVKLILTLALSKINTPILEPNRASNPFFMGLVGKGAWHNWPRQHLVRFARHHPVQHEPIGFCQHDLAAVQVFDGKLSSTSSPQPRLPVLLGLRGCPLQRASSTAIRSPIRLPHHSLTARISPMIGCAVRRTFRLIVELRLPQRIKNGRVTGSRRVVVQSLQRLIVSARLITPISANGLPVRATFAIVCF